MQYNGVAQPRWASDTANGYQCPASMNMTANLSVVGSWVPAFPTPAATPSNTPSPRPTYSPGPFPQLACPRNTAAGAGATLSTALQGFYTVCCWDPCDACV